MGFWSNLANGTKDFLFGSQPKLPGLDDPRFQLQHGKQIGDFALGQLGQQAPQVGRVGIDMAPQNQFRAGELDLMNQLRGVASGQQMGAGEMAVQRQGQQAISGIHSGARMARGANAATGARDAARAVGALGVDLSQAGREAASADQGQARGLLANVLGQGRQSDIGLATTQASLDQQRNLANQQGQFQQGQYNLGLLNALLSGDQAQLQAYLGLAGLGQQYGGKEGHLGDILSMAGQLGSAAIMSDERVKEKIEDGGGAVREFLRSISPKTYDYKDPRHGEGRHIGVIAQDMERSKMGKAIVRETPDGKALDGRKTISALLASVADLNSRVEKVETAPKPRAKARPKKRAA